VSELPPFDVRAYQSQLATRWVGRFLVYRFTVGSTMDLARREAAEGGPHGTLVMAEEQTAGRGRKGRSFFSPRGENLYVTYLLRLDEEQYRRLPLAVPLAACRACEAECPDVRIKWPNDLWIGTEKVSGMLVDVEFEGTDIVAFPGIGINVNGDPTVVPELRGIATSLRRALGRTVSREGVLARLSNELEYWLSAPWAELARAYRERNFLLGREIVVHPPTGEPYPARAVDIADDGSLVVEAGGRREALRAAEVTVRPQ